METTCALIDDSIAGVSLEDFEKYVTRDCFPRIFECSTYLALMNHGSANATGSSDSPNKSPKIVLAPGISLCRGKHVIFISFSIPWMRFLSDYVAREFVQSAYEELGRHIKSKRVVALPQSRVSDVFYEYDLSQIEQALVGKIERFVENDAYHINNIRSGSWPVNTLVIVGHPYTCKPSSVHFDEEQLKPFIEYLNTSKKMQAFHQGFATLLHKARWYHETGMIEGDCEEISCTAKECQELIGTALPHSFSFIIPVPWVEFLTNRKIQKTTKDIFTEMATYLHSNQVLYVPAIMEAQVHESCEGHINDIVASVDTWPQEHKLISTLRVRVKRP